MEPIQVALLTGMFVIALLGFVLQMILAVTKKK